MLDQKELKSKAYKLRIEALKLIARGGGGHTGGDLSEADILTVLFYNIIKHSSSNPLDENRDRFILSKGHAVETYYVILADLGFISAEELKTFSKFGSRLTGHPNKKIQGIEANTGSLGHGLSVGVGMALAAKMNKMSYNVYVLMGDGEQAEGSVWEAAMSASNYKLDNLCAIVDRNRLQISGGTEDVMGLEPFKQKWEAFGFDVIEIDGHDHAHIQSAFEKKTQQPKLILANTVKGKGVSFMENVAKWHHGVPTEEQLNMAIKELGGEI